MRFEEPKKPKKQPKTDIMQYRNHVYEIYSSTHVLTNDHNRKRCCIPFINYLSHAPYLPITKSRKTQHRHRCTPEISSIRRYEGKERYITKPSSIHPNLTRPCHPQIKAPSCSLRRTSWTLSPSVVGLVVFSDLAPSFT